MSNDKEIQQELIKKLCKQYNLLEEELNKIVAFCFPLWGSRQFFKHEGVYRYKIKWARILDVPNARFQSLLGKAIRNTRNKLGMIDTLWESRKEDNYLETKYGSLSATPSITANDDLFSTEAEFGAGEEAVGEKEADNLLYGIWEDEDT